MKKFTLMFLAFMLMTISANAQNLVFDFENWTNSGSYEEPVGWVTMNNISQGPFYSCTKSTDHYPSVVGSYSLRIENNTSLTQMTGGWGLVATGSFNFPLEPAFPISGHPNSLNGYYKYNSVNDDSLWIYIVLFDNGLEVFSESFRTMVSTASWTPFTINFPTYTSADSGFIMTGAFYPDGPTASGPKGNSVLYVDNLSFDNLITPVAELPLKESSITIYPNPASEKIFLNINNSNGQDVKVNIYSLAGSLVRAEAIRQNSCQLDLGDLENGIYLVEIKSKDSEQKQKLIIRR